MSTKRLAADPVSIPPGNPDAVRIARFAPAFRLGAGFVLALGILGPLGRLAQFPPDARGLPPATALCLVAATAALLLTVGMLIGIHRSGLALRREEDKRLASEWRLRRLAEAVREIAAVRDHATLAAIVRRSARELLAADGATLVLREGGFCHYVDEDAMEPLWKGRRFPANACIAGEAMKCGQAIAVEDVHAHPRISHAAYRPTFVKSLSVAPIGTAPALGCIGCHWARRHRAAPEELALQQALADATAVGLANLALVDSLEARVAERAGEAREAEARFRNFVTRAPIAMWVVEGERIALRNEQFVSLFGYGEDEFATLAEWWLLAFPEPAYRDWAKLAWRTAMLAEELRHGRIDPVEYRIRCRDGSSRVVEVSGVGLSGGFLVTFADITERHRLAEALRADKLLAERASQAKGDFLANMSHEIRTPMNAIIGMTQVLDRTPLSAEQHHLVGTIRTAGRGLLAIVNDVLDFSKIESGHFRLEQSPFLLSNVLSSVVDVLTPTAVAKNLALTLAPLPVGVDALVGDSQRLSQVLYNLAGNALKFTGEGQVSLVVQVIERRGEEVKLRFAVLDTGIGIPEDKCRRIFEPFVQADTEKERDK